MKFFNKITGSKNEIIAENYLKKIGYKILQTNFSCKLGEVDIIAKDKNCIVFVEVKAKSNVDFGYPREMVNKTKQKKIRKVAQVYLLQNHEYDCDCRFDVIEILDEKIEHLKNCF